MRHSKVQQLFSAALDEELSARQRLRFEEHLQQCAECRHQFELFELTHSLLGEEEGELSDGFTERLVGRLREERRQEGTTEEGKYFRNLRLALGAAALLLLFLWGDRLHNLSAAQVGYSGGYVQHDEQQVRSWTP